MALNTFIRRLEENNLVRFDILGETEAHFTNRFKIQKYVYLARHFGLDLGYNYSIYLHGPYSRDLADEYYSLAEKPIDEETRLPDAFRMNEFLDFVRGKDSNWLEASSTLLSLNNSFRDRACLLRRVSNMKPHISAARLEYILRELERSNLVRYN